MIKTGTPISRNKVSETTHNTRLDKSEVAPLFDLATESEILRSLNEYLPVDLTQRCHSVTASFILKDTKDRVIHEVNFVEWPSYATEHPIPKILRELNDKAAAIVHKKFGPSPPMYID